MPDYVQDSNNDEKQVAGKLPDNAYDRASVPVTGSVNKAASYIIIGNLTDEVGFYLGSSGSYSTTHTAQGTTGKTLGGQILSGSQHYAQFGKPAAGTILNIHPIAWSGSKADNNAVSSLTFVYGSGLGTGGR